MNKKRWKDIPLARKVMLAVGSIMTMMLAINVILYGQVNKTIKRMDTVYSSNVNLTELSDSLQRVQEDLYAYLSVKSSDSLESYYRSKQNYVNLLDKLSSQISSNPSRLLEKNIKVCQKHMLPLQRRR